MTPAEHREPPERIVDSGMGPIVECPECGHAIRVVPADDKRVLDERLVSCERELLVTRAKAEDRERVLVEALGDLFRWVRRMPDAGLTSDDPRYSWWSDGYDAREQARAALDSIQEGERS